MFHVFNCLFFMNFSLVRGCLLRERFLVIFGQGVHFSVSAVPFGPGIDIWRSCRFIGAMVRSLCFLPGGLGRFVPCSTGANHCRLRHIGWERCGHGFISRPRESASEPFFSELLGLFSYPSGSARALLAGTLPVRYCTAMLAGSLLGGCRCLDTLLAWLLLILGFLRVVGLRFLVGRFTGLVVLVRDGKECD